MRITLTVTEGPHQGQVFTFDGHDTFLVGRSKRAHFRLPTKDRYFSRIHFLVEINPPNCRLMDMSSSNGTYVNGQKVERTDLHDGDSIRAGQTVLRVAVTPGPERSDEHRAVPPTVPPAVPAVGRSSGHTPYKTPPTPATPVVEGSGGHPTYKTPEPPAVGGSSGHRALKTAEAPIVSASGGQRPYMPPEAPIAGSSGAQRPYTPPELPPPPPSSVVPHALPADCPGCGAPLTDADEFSLCPTCHADSNNQRQTIEGYRLIRELGRGSMGLVYLAVRRNDFWPVALKTIIPAAGGSEAQVTRFLREAGILRQLEHPNIVAFRDMGESGGMLYFAMDFVRGQDAYKMLKKQGLFEIRRAANLICQLLDALDFAHSNGFVHRDIKPSNLLITTQDGPERLMVADFGLAKVYQASNLSGLTMTGDVGGTVPFMAPEQITEYRTARPPVDQYSAAATLYNLLTGAYVYNFPASFQNQLLTILNESPVPIRKRRSEVPEGLAAVIHRGLARDPAGRYPDAGAMRDALRKYA
ncbi:MAG TPA: FHA domain-containing serine/threonine-protein kinase [Gemmataceae bacterium]|nr:FHA domain-containing serine/threonine-protein kinase [Gemmataceae bacterium]